MSGGGDHLRSVHGYDTVVREHWLDVVRHAVENLSTIVLNEVLLCVGVGCISQFKSQLKLCGFGGV